ncbi:MAG: CDP-glycerol glycerophosphotransferase family protein, partial [Desulfovibrionaceae bacterium]
LSPPRPCVLFVGRAGGRLMDNVKYAFLHAATHDCGFDPLFLTTYRDEYHMLRDAHLPVVLDRLCTPALLQQAALVVVDDFPDKMGAPLLHLQHTPFLQLWHGIPLKKIGFPEIESRVNMTPDKAKMLAACYSGYAAVASTSPWVTQELFSKVFHAHEFWDTGYPRNDALLRPPTRQDMINVDSQVYSRMLQHQKTGGRIFMYMPTFRDTGGDFITDGVLDMESLLALCQRHNILVVAKFHPYLRCEAMQGLNHFIMCDSASDAYPLLRLTDALITDYSSVYFDYLLLDKPILFFAYDQDKYIRQDRELFFEYADMAPGPIATDQTALFAHMLNLIRKEDNYAPARKSLRERLFARTDDTASAQVCARIRQSLTSVPQPPHP